MSKSNSSSTRLSNVPVTFLGVMALLVLALGWLGWLLLDQDLSLNKQRINERVEAAVVELEGAVSNGIDTHRKTLDDFVAVLRGPGLAEPRVATDSLDTTATLVYFSPTEITVKPAAGLRYIPAPEEPASLPTDFHQADYLEFKEQDFSAALEMLGPLAESSEAHVRAAALMRIGRIKRRAGRIDDALNTYLLLTGLKEQRVGATPADWLGFYARCSIFAAESRMSDLESELTRLVRTLTGGGRQVTEANYRFYIDAAIDWARLTGQPDTVQQLSRPHVETELANDIFNLWSERWQSESEISGIQIGGEGPGYALGIWIAFEQDLFVSVFALSEFHANSLNAVTEKMEGRGIGWRISDARGVVLLSSSPASSGGAISQRTLAIEGTALTVSTFGTADMTPDPSDTTRRRLLLTGLFLTLAIILASTYLIARSLRREAEIAQLQSNFVAAVSHEFRTPLTSIRQLTEMLASGRVDNPERAMTYYRILQKESARLQRLVEGLLDFGRMEAGAHPYRPEILECGVFLAEIVTTFREEYGLTEQSLSLEIKGKPYVCLDKETLTRAIWNLLDNAVKYSPDVLRIRVGAQVKRDKVRISVADQGVGVAGSEQSEIFDKFVRGSAARLTNARGTGMGLAMVRKIVEDQGGSISVRANPDGGSIFIIELMYRRVE